MLHATVIVAALVAPYQTAPCSEQCTCGCNKGKPCTCGNGPAAKPAAQAGQEKRAVEDGRGDAFPVDPDGTWNFGLDRKKIDGRTKYRFGDQEISRQEAMRLIEEGIPDDANKLRVTVIGPDADRKRVVADLDGPAFAQLKSLYTVQSYDPSNPMIQGLGFVTSGRPTVYVQKPDGTVMHRQDEYDGPAKLITAIRRADPNYNPANDPDLTKPPPKPDGGGGAPFSLDRVPAWAVAALALGVLLLIVNQGKEDKK